MNGVFKWIAGALVTIALALLTLIGNFHLSDYRVLANEVKEQGNELARRETNVQMIPAVRDNQVKIQQELAFHGHILRALAKKEGIPVEEPKDNE